jgi:class 3 adenylate cyclase
MPSGTSEWKCGVTCRAEPKRVSREGAQLQFKEGLHTGPLIAVELNERLDYFGQTVNVAARVQGVAGADEIAITEPVYAAPGAQDIIRGAERLARAGPAQGRGGRDHRLPPEVRRERSIPLIPFPGGLPGRH